MRLAAKDSSRIGRLMKCAITAEISSVATTTASTTPSQVRSAGGRTRAGSTPSHQASRSTAKPTHSAGTPLTWLAITVPLPTRARTVSPMRCSARSSGRPR